MEVITTVTQAHYVVLVILGIISAGIIGVIIFKKIEKYKKYQFHKNHALDMDVDKIENAFNKILMHVYDLEEFINASESAWKIDLEIQSIRGIIKHQLGHIPRMRGWLK